MSEMPLKSLWISYCIPCSITWKGPEKMIKPSHPPLRVVTMHPGFFTHGVRVPFHFFFLGICLAILCALLLN